MGVHYSKVKNDDFVLTAYAAQPPRIVASLFLKIPLWTAQEEVLFICPAQTNEPLEKAKGLDCDVILFDLEDAVAPEAKALARTQVLRGSRRSPSRRWFLNQRASDTY